jgi:hypothetical protein
MEYIKNLNNIKMGLEHFTALPVSHSLAGVCKTWCVTLREEYWLEVVEKRVLRNIYLGVLRPRRGGRIIFKKVLNETEWPGGGGGERERLDWIQRAQNRGKWWALVNVLTKVRIP